MTVSIVPPECAAAVLAQVRPMIEKALARGQGDRTTFAALCAEIGRGDIMLWAVHEGAEVVAVIGLQVMESAANKVLFVHFIAGRALDDWADEAERLLTDYRDVIGASCIEASCRDGLVRYLSRRGWRKKATIMSMECA